MRVLHLSTYDAGEGAARGAYWQHRALLAAGVESRMLVLKASAGDKTVDQIGGAFASEWRPRLERAPLHLYPRREDIMFSPAWLPNSVPRVVRALQPDLVNLHWVNDGLINPEAIGALGVPVVWTLRDTWAFTGGCHYTRGCTRFQQSCGVCPQLGSRTPSDLSHLLWWRKRRAWVHLDLTIVALSRWLADLAGTSSLFAGRAIEVIPNALDPQCFRPLIKRDARATLGLPQDVPLVLFGAVDPMGDTRKGGQLLFSALDHLSSLASRGAQLIVFGGTRRGRDDSMSLPANYLGRIDDDATLARLYSAADVMVVPSTEEAFGKTAIEALACATPVVSFDVGGLRDIVEHVQNGYRAAPFYPADLAHGIEWVLADEERRRHLGERGRAKVLAEFSYVVQAASYSSLYRRAMGASASAAPSERPAWGGVLS